LDEVLDEATARCRREVEKRTEPLTPEERDTVTERIASASVKYALLSVEPVKTVTFTWDRVLNLESNSAPFINYAYTRACGILRKLPDQKAEPCLGGLTHPLERQILLAIIKFPEAFKAAADQLRPESLTAYANSLAEKFHEYYEKVSVIRTEEPKLRAARRLLINAVKVTLENCLGTLGIALSEKM
ncbi:MAG: DALR anticodon-binding domain-containing protein, partial [Candidatus Bathyarchaeia archaeon]